MHTQARWAATYVGHSAEFKQLDAARRLPLRPACRRYNVESSYGDLYVTPQILQVFEKVLLLLPSP